MKKKISVFIGVIVFIAMMIININFTNNSSNGDISLSSTVKQAQATEDEYNVDCVKQLDTKCDGNRNQAYP